MQLVSCYDSRAHILYVTLVRARRLQTRRPNGDARPDPFVRCVLLPGRKTENERRTRYLILTSDPEWHQTMVYPAVTPAELRQRQLEVTVWHHQSDGRHEFLGEFLLDLAGKQTQLVVSSPEKKRINRLVQVGILTLFTTSLVLYLTNKLQLH